MRVFSRLRLWQQVLLISLTFVIGVFLGGAITDQAVNDSTPNSSQRAIPHDWNELRSTFLRYDTIHYRSIAESGYQSVADTAFFPLYPLVVRGLHLSTGISIDNALLTVSILAFLGAMIVTTYWIRYELRSRKIKLSPLYVLGIMLVFPTSFYLVLGYTESLFVLLSVSAIFTYRTKHYFWSSVLMALAASCRIQGIIVATLFMVDYLRARNWQKLLPIAGAIVGLGAYMFWLYGHFDSALSFVAAQQEWGRLSGNVFSGLIDSFTPAYAWYLPILVLCLIAVYRTLGISWFACAILYFLLPLASGRLDSLNRFMIGLPIIFLALGIMLGSQKTERLKLAYIVSSALLLAFNITLFSNGYFVG